VTRNGKPNGRKRGDEALIHALAVGVSVAAAAGHARLSKRTAYRRLEDPAFRARVDEARAEIVSGVVGRLSGIGVLAGDTLKDLLGDSSSSIRLGAARAALEFMFRGNEQDTLARQLRQLQQQIEALQVTSRSVHRLHRCFKLESSICTHNPPRIKIGARISTR
jgi:hypothetical protein